LGVVDFSLRFWGGDPQEGMSDTELLKSMQVYAEPDRGCSLLSVRRDVAQPDYKFFSLTFMLFPKEVFNTVCTVERLIHSTGSVEARLFPRRELVGVTTSVSSSKATVRKLDSNNFKVFAPYVDGDYAVLPVWHQAKYSAYTILFPVLRELTLFSRNMFFMYSKVKGVTLFSGFDNSVTDIVDVLKGEASASCEICGAGGSDLVSDVVMNKTVCLPCVLRDVREKGIKSVLQWHGSDKELVFV